MGSAAVTNSPPSVCGLHNIDFSFPSILSIDQAALETPSGSMMEAALIL